MLICSSSSLVSPPKSEQHRIRVKLTTKGKVLYGGIRPGFKSILDVQMALYIHCGFARVTLRNLLREHAESNGHQNVSYDIIEEYNDQ